MAAAQQHRASYRDPAGFVFEYEGSYYRQVNECYASQYDQLVQSGLYEELVNRQWLLPHAEVDYPATEAPKSLYKTLLPQQLSFISFASEWSFTQLKAAALLTLQIQQTALQKGMSLKDATPYNVQFVSSRPVFIDTLSLETYNEQQPWIAYRQFCETFLYPLLLEYYNGVPVHKTGMAWPDGIDAPTVARLLPRRTRWRMATALHVHLPARVARRAKGTPATAPQQGFSRRKMEHLVSHLLSAVEGLQLKPKTVWSDYYTHTILGGDYLSRKTGAVTQLFSGKQYTRVLDLGSNDGVFTKLALHYAKEVIAADSDAGCIHQLYQSLQQEPPRPIHALVFDVAQPTPAMGFMNAERPAAMQRLKADCVLALALIHHLCVGGYLRFEDVAQVLAQLGDELVIEFVSVEDEKVKQLLAQHPRDVAWYTRENFETHFAIWFEFAQTIVLLEGCRYLYQMKKKNA
jgi:hypothetical protein